MVACDHGGYELKEKILPHLHDQGYEIEDIGVHSPESCDYPLYAVRVGRTVAAGEVNRGILICGSGVGMCIAANRIPGVRAVQASEPFLAKMSRRHNDSNVLCLGGRFIGPDLALEVVNVWLQEPFDGGRHQRRVDLIDSLSSNAAGSESVSLTGKLGQKAYN